jgi:ribosome-binding factor A
MFSITKADVSKDLKNAKVFVSVFSTNSEKAKATFDAIVSDAKRIRYELAQSMNIRSVPELHFIYDDSMEYSQKISGLLHKIEKGEEN